MKVLMCDPPEGWMYGFPKPFPGGTKMTPNDRIRWFKLQGYPQELIDQGMLRYVRYWEATLEFKDHIEEDDVLE